MTKTAALEAHVDTLWNGLTRTLTAENIKEMVYDSKVKAQDGKLYLYVPESQVKIAKTLFTAVQVKALSNDPEPGLLSLAWHNNQPLPYCVPGGRFNEVYGWDTYFIVLGLLESNRHQLAINMLRHHCYEIDHYGMILNANRTYYLNRSQPPFLTDMLLQIWTRGPDKQLLKFGMDHAIQEYNTVWMSPPRFDPESGLSRYRPPPTNRIPIEVEPGHFDDILAPFAESFGLSIAEFTNQYNSKTIQCPELDTFLHHDLGVRESGHDTSTRLYNTCADLATIDLNCLLYKYEKDLAHISQLLGLSEAEHWNNRAQTRKSSILKYMWDEQDAMFYDYNTITKSKHRFPSATCLWTLWSGLCPPEYAPKFVQSALAKFEQPGGIVTTTPLSSHRQWDFPTGWAPHQILAWKGLHEYGFKNEAQRLSSKWLDMIDNVWKTEGLIFEKYNVVDCTHGVDAEYGNQGTFNEGFGWTNASILLAKKYK